MKLFSQKNKKALIIGLDGVPYSLLNTYIKNDMLPNLKQILNHGFHLHQMNASIPDVSSVSWTTFNTGVNPGEHGIYGFTDLQAGSYSLYFPNFRDVKAPTFWEILGKTNRKTSTLYQKYFRNIDHRHRSIILNVPHTYPASPVNGVLVSGFVAIDLKKATFPESAYSYLRSMNYRIDVDAEKAKESKPLLLKEIFECFEIRKKAISHFFNEEPWDLFLACFTETDRLNHFFFDALSAPNHPYYNDLVNFFMALDQFIKILYEGFIEKYSEKGFFMILSDHGFATVKKEVYINRFLKENGFLVLKNEGDFYERIEDKTKAFNLDPCRIYINDQNSFQRGTVKRDERIDLIKDLKEALKKLKGDKGEDVIDKIYEKEEIYHGPHIDRAPDLICLPRDGYDLKGSLGKKEIFGHNIFTGMHSWSDAFCILPENIRLSEKPSIEQMADHIMKYFSQQ